MEESKNGTYKKAENTADLMVKRDQWDRVE